MGLLVKATVDRIEGHRAVLLLVTPQGEIAVDWPIAMLPERVHEGSKLDLRIQEDRQAEADARQRVAGLLEKLTGREPKKP